MSFKRWQYINKKYLKLRGFWCLNNNHYRHRRSGGMNNPIVEFELLNHTLKICERCDDKTNNWKLIEDVYTIDDLEGKLRDYVEFEWLEYEPHYKERRLDECNGKLSKFVDYTPTAFEKNALFFKNESNTKSNGVYRISFSNLYPPYIVTNPHIMFEKSNGSNIKDNKLEQQIVKSKYKFALYYVNAYGEKFLIESNDKLFNDAKWSKLMIYNQESDKVSSDYTQYVSDIPYYVDETQGFSELVVEPIDNE